MRVLIQQLWTEDWGPAFSTSLKAMPQPPTQRPHSERQGLRVVHLGICSPEGPSQPAPSLCRGEETRPGPRSQSASGLVRLCPPVLEEQGQGLRGLAGEGEGKAESSLGLARGLRVSGVLPPACERGAGRQPSGHEGSSNGPHQGCRKQTSPRAKCPGSPGVGWAWGRRAGVGWHWQGSGPHW